MNPPVITLYDVPGHTPQPWAPNIWRIRYVVCLTMLDESCLLITSYKDSSSITNVFDIEQYGSNFKKSNEHYDVSGLLLLLCAPMGIQSTHYQYSSILIHPQPSLIPTILLNISSLHIRLVPYFLKEREHYRLSSFTIFKKCFPNLFFPSWSPSAISNCLNDLRRTSMEVMDFPTL